MPILPVPPPDRPDAVDWVRDHLGDLVREPREAVAASAFDGGQKAADAALAGLDITGYASTRSTVLPRSARGASRLSPYIRHGLLPLPEVWSAVEGAPDRDRAKYRDELLWQEYARHLYSRLGGSTSRPLRYGPPRTGAGWSGEPWPDDMACMSAMVTELREDGWLVNQARMWLASQWAVRAGRDWAAGEDEMFAHLVDGSRAANRLGWQWTVGTGSGKPYGFSRWQVLRRAPSLCASCALADDCPVESWPDAEPGAPVDGPDLGRAPIPAGPAHVEGGGGEVVWLTAESLGGRDPALAAVPDRPAVFVFDEPLLARLRLSGTRLVFLAQTLGELATTRPVHVHRGRPEAELAGRRVAATWTPVPGWRRRSRTVRPVEVHPWPWLIRPESFALLSYSAWRRHARPR
ncbi:FAD-binding domain-containing protein [Umezawaea sp. Da 62-37]|uniref:FAD-binding domain-containing protein n=1 Tax=Umezawaea sp. Da 62-37 TaxID=3075927 RepID=UPI0028F729CC|nr:FAD-binding domain-containing protein [Umezawaea sp. Da 62-37]WNV87099.1 FAD-binding domain-containing protein [Umezawaea sp. Da 62-37]